MHNSNFKLPLICFENSENDILWVASTNNNENPSQMIGKKMIGVSKNEIV